MASEPLRYFPGQTRYSQLPTLTPPCLRLTPTCFCLGLGGLRIPWEKPRLQRPREASARQCSLVQVRAWQRKHRQRRGECQVLSAWCCKAIAATVKSSCIFAIYVFFKPLGVSTAVTANQISRGMTVYTTPALATRPHTHCHAQGKFLPTCCLLPTVLSLVFVFCNTWYIRGLLFTPILFQGSRYTVSDAVYHPTVITFFDSAKVSHWVITANFERGGDIWYTGGNKGRSAGPPSGGGGVHDTGRSTEPP